MGRSHVLGPVFSPSSRRHLAKADKPHGTPGFGPVSRFSFDAERKLWDLPTHVSDTCVRQVSPPTGVRHMFPPIVPTHISTRVSQADALHRIIETRVCLLFHDARLLITI